MIPGQILEYVRIYRPTVVCMNEYSENRSNDCFNDPLARCR